MGVPRRLLGCPQGRQLGRQDRRGGQAVVAEGASVGILKSGCVNKMIYHLCKGAREERAPLLLSESVKIPRFGLSFTFMGS